MTVYYVWLVIFAICLYLVITDTSIAQLIILYSRWWRLQYEKIKWWVLYNPQNPVVKYLMWRKSMKMAEELMKEFEND
jgi:hypothetical protein